MQLKKLCNHSFLLGTEPPLSLALEELLQGSAKLCLLDRMLVKLKARLARLASLVSRVSSLLSFSLTSILISFYFLFSSCFS